MREIIIIVSISLAIMQCTANATSQDITALQKLVKMWNNLDQSLDNSVQQKISIAAKHNLETINYAQLTPQEVNNLCYNILTYLSTILTPIEKNFWPKYLDSKELQNYNKIRQSILTPQCLLVKDLIAAGEKLKKTHDISIKKVLYYPDEDIKAGIMIDIFLPAGVQEMNIKPSGLNWIKDTVNPEASNPKKSSDVGPKKPRSSGLPTPKAPTPPSYTKHVEGTFAPDKYLTPTFYNASSKEMNIKVRNVTQWQLLSPGATWAKKTARHALIEVACTGFNQIQVHLSSLPAGTLYVALDAGRFRFGSKTPQSPILDYKPMTKAEAMKAYPKLKPAVVR